MPVDRRDYEFSPKTIEEAFQKNMENAPRGCPGYWCEWCYFSSGFRKYFQVDHIIPIAGAEKYGYTKEEMKLIQNACILCNGCNQSKSVYACPRPGVGLAYRMPNENLTWGHRRGEALSWDEFIQMAKRKGRFARTT